jgi:hypothetical protein
MCLSVCLPACPPPAVVHCELVYYAYGRYIFILRQLFQLTAVLPPTLSVIQDGAPVAGQTFALLCRVVLPDGLPTRPSIAWYSPQGNVLMSEGELTVGNQQVIGSPSRVSTYAIQFSPVLTSHGGTYTCRATVSSPRGTLQESVTMAQNLTVESKRLNI